MIDYALTKLPDAQPHYRLITTLLDAQTAPAMELVRQEFYSWVLMHYTVRWLLHQGAARRRIPHEDCPSPGMCRC